MTSSPAVRTLAPVVLAAALLSGCGDGTDGPETDDPTSTTADDASCAGVTTEQLAGWTGTEQVFRTAEEGGERAECSTEYDSTGLIIEWSLRPVTGSFEVEGENAQLTGLDRDEIELASGIAAWQLSGVVSGNRLASVVTVLDGGERTLTVEAGDDGDEEATVTDEQLDEVVVRLAETISEELGA